MSLDRSSSSVESNQRETSRSAVRVAAVLDLARDAADNALRPAPLLTAFVARYAAGRSGTGAYNVDVARDP
ncbi:DUF6457 domain-containing protein [Leifsonia sp. fls2-241-R2A-40a]|uniref:DUF6457 domain-containing protein n=1 Tax=Leifsonia sp. fls2-241-R2A-40a TaxID=3040290 RepID=UPI00254CF21C|nr:DUF6457 domain-containing protein [Leifsonia sp. fls2-241-R2A-40a]